MTMDGWNRGTHGSRGLIEQGEGIDAVQESAVEAAQRSRSCASHVPAKETSPMCGNWISQDRRFLAAAGCPTSRTTSTTATST